jgi:hypothetical protein
MLMYVQSYSSHPATVQSCRSSVSRLIRAFGQPDVSCDVIVTVRTAGTESVQFVGEWLAVGMSERAGRVAGCRNVRAGGAVSCWTQMTAPSGRCPVLKRPQRLKL